MADDVKAEGRVEPVLDGHGLRIGIAASRFNDHITLRLLEGAAAGWPAPASPAVTSPRSGFPVPSSCPSPPTG